MFASVTVQGRALLREFTSELSDWDTSLPEEKCNKWDLELYLKTVQKDCQSEVEFILCNARLAPQSEPTIPRLELCVAVLAVVMADLIQEELYVKLDFYSDSKVVLGYIHSATKRFYIYVHNRHATIMKSETPGPSHHTGRSKGSRTMDFGWQETHKLRTIQLHDMQEA